MNLGFAAPLWLSGLLVLPLLAWWLERGEAPAITLPDAASARSRAARLLGRLPTALRLLVLAFLLLALARPRSAVGTVDDPAQGVPVVVAIDLSSSMLAQDFAPRDRIGVAREVVADFVEARTDDPVGIVAFAAEAITVAPVTRYRPVVLDAVHGLRVGMLPDGTAIGDGLAVAINRVRHAAGRERVVVLMSDGESNRGSIDPLDAAAAAAQLGVRVFTIGVGSGMPARVPVTRGGEVVVGEVEAGLDEALLREIADATGGAYFRATDPSALASIYAEIDRLTATRSEERRRLRYREWYPLMLMIAVGLLATEWLLRGSRWGALPG